MAALLIEKNAKATWHTGLADARAQAGDISQRVAAYAAASVMICAVGAALVRLVVQILSFPVPIAVTAITLMAAALLTRLRCRLRPRPGVGPGQTRIARRDNPARS